MKKNSRESFLFVLITSAFFLFTGITTEGFAASAKLNEILGSLPVQSGGRVKPFQSFAQETVLSVTANRTCGEKKPTECVWQWIALPEKWNAEAVIPVAFRPLQKEFETMLVHKKLTPEVIFNHTPFLEKVREASQKQQRKEGLVQIERERLALYQKAAIFHEIAAGETPGWIANPGDPRATWASFQDIASEEGAVKLMRDYSEEGVTDVRSKLQRFIEAYRLSPDSPATLQAASEFAGALRKLFESRNIILDEGVLRSEVLYHQLRPFAWAWKIYLLSLIVFLIASVAWFSKKIPQARWIGFFFFTAAFLMHAYGFYLRCIIAGRPPVSNMYESIVWVSWGACFFSLILFFVYRAAAILIAASSVAVFALLIAESFPAVLDPALSPLVPVLRSNLWLSIHVLTITLSYGAFALAWGLGHAVVAGFAFHPERQERNKILAQYLYRAIQIGVILLASGTVLGGVWANYSWGRFWGWDPKETWALIALLGYLAILHGRFAGWLDIFALAAGSVIAFAGVVMAWYGVNFVLAAGLHSYGFGGGGAVYITGVALLDLAWLGWMSWIYHRRCKLMTR